MAKRAFKYTARDRRGIAVSGEVEAENAKTVSHSLKELDYVVVSIEETRLGRLDFLNKARERFFAVTNKDILLFLRQMSAMVKAGLPLLNSLSNIIDQTKNAHLRKILINIASDVRGGRSLSDALSRYPRFFSDFHINMIKAGETGGMLADVLDKLAVIGYEDQELKGRLQSAFAYPVLLVALSLFIVAVLLTFVLPKFINIFQESGAKLPLPTQVLLLISGAVRRFWYVLPALAAVSGAHIYHRIREPKGRYSIHKKILSFPLIGRLVLIVALSRFCKIMGALTKSGIPLLNALGVSEGLLGNEVLVNAISHVKQAVTSGATLSGSLNVSGVFPAMMVQMVAVGESTGKLDEMFFQVGDYYDKESALAIRTLTTLIEPVLLLVMGLIVGFIALSVLLPIFNLVKVLKH